MKPFAYPLTGKPCSCSDEHRPFCRACRGNGFEIDAERYWPEYDRWRRENEAEIRQERAEGKRPPLHTPWGTLDNDRQVADGFWWVDTPSHGGIWLSAERTAAYRRCFRSETVPQPPWLEEDDEWRFAVLAFPECASDETLWNALTHYDYDLSDGWWRDHPDVRARRDAFVARMSGHWRITCAGSMSASDCDLNGVPRGSVVWFARRVTDNQLREVFAKRFPSTSFFSDEELDQHDISRGRELR